MTYSVAMLGRTVADEIAIAVGSVPDPAIQAALDVLSSANRIYAFGEGRSGLVLRMGTMRLVHLGKLVHIVGDSTTPAIGSDDLMIVGSGSGGTPTTVLIAEQARKIGAGILTITANGESRLAQLADTLLLITTPAKAGTGTGRSIQPGGTLFEQSMLVLLDSLFLLLAGDNPEEQIGKRHANLE